MRFQAPLLLWLALPWLAGWLLFARAQKRALAWVLANVARRFRSRFSVHTPATLAWHLRLLAVMGLLLIVAAARPYRPGEAEIEAERARVVLIFDASASMFATDLGVPAPGADPASELSKNRFEHARAAGRMLIEALPATTFALVSFSGTAAIHTPMSADRGFLLDAVRGLEIHGQYQTTGSSLAGALDTIFEFQDETRPNLQAVILTDGEQPVDEDFGDTLEALAGQGVPVHTVAIGTTEGQSRLIYDFRDIVADKDNPTVLREYHTRRVDTAVREIAKTTGGLFEVLAPGTIERLAAAVEEYRSPPARIERAGTGADLGGLCLLAFLAGLVADGLLIGRRPRHAPLRFEIDRLGEGRAPSKRVAAALLLVPALLGSSACGNTPRARAYRENEQGIALDALRRYEDARSHYQRSIGYGVEPQIPTFNLARSVHRQGGYSEAHDLYQDALTLDPRLPEAYYNDGLALFDWGRAEIDPRGCDLERTRELWSRALQRFARAVELTKVTHTTGRMARSNRTALEEQLAGIERLIADPPPECRQGGGGSQSQESQDPKQGGGGGGGDEDENQGQGGGGSGGDEDQGQGGGGGGDEPEDQGGGEGNDGEDQGGGEGDDREDQGGGDGDDPEDQGGGDGDDQRDQGGGPGDDRESQGGGGPGPLSREELDRIGRELERIAGQGREEGKFHRRTLPEQFSREHWSNPDRVIWW